MLKYPCWLSHTTLLAVAGAVWAIASSMHAAYALCGLLQPTRMLYRHYVGYRRRRVGCCVLYACCTGAMWSVIGAVWNVTSYMWDVASSMWAIAASMHAVYALYGMLHPLCGLLHSLCMLCRCNMGCYRLCVGYSILYVVY